MTLAVILVILAVLVSVGGLLWERAYAPNRSDLRAPIRSHTYRKDGK